MPPETSFVPTLVIAPMAIYGLVTLVVYAMSGGASWTQAILWPRLLFRRKR